MGGESQFTMTEKSLKAFTMIACLVGQATNCKQMGIHMLETSNKGQNLEKEAFIGSIRDRCTQEIGLEAYHMEKVNT